MSAATDNIGVARRAMNQTAIWWELSGLDEFGQPTYSTPVEIECRWEDVVEEFVNDNGDREISKSKLIVDRDIAVKSQIKLGELDSFTEDNPDNEADTWEVRSFLKTPDFKGSKFLREVYL